MTIPSSVVFDQAENRLLRAEGHSRGTLIVLRPVALQPLRPLLKPPDSHGRHSTSTAPICSARPLVAVVGQAQRRQVHAVQPRSLGRSRTAVVSSMSRERRATASPPTPTWAETAPSCWSTPADSTPVAGSGPDDLSDAGARARCRRRHRRRRRHRGADRRRRPASPPPDRDVPPTRSATSDTARRCWLPTRPTTRRGEALGRRLLRARPGRARYPVSAYHNDWASTTSWRR